MGVVGGGLGTREGCPYDAYAVVTIFLGECFVLACRDLRGALPVFLFFSGLLFLSPGNVAQKL